MASSQKTFFKVADFHHRLYNRVGLKEIIQPLSPPG